MGLGEGSSVTELHPFNLRFRDKRDICSSLELFAREVMPEFTERHSEHEAWKAAVLNGEIELEDIDTDPYSFSTRQAPSKKSTREARDMVAGVVGRPRSRAITR